MCTFVEKKFFCVLRSGSSWTTLRMSGIWLRCKCNHAKCCNDLGGFRWVSRAMHYRHVLADMLHEAPPEGAIQLEDVPEPEFGVQELLTTQADIIRMDDVEEPEVVLTHILSNKTHNGLYNL